MDFNPQRIQNVRNHKSSIFSKIFNLFSIGNKTEEAVESGNSENDELLENIKNARKEWADACANFEYVNEEEVVDYYTYKIKACQVKYDYLIKKAKEKGIKVDIIETQDPVVIDGYINN